MRNRIASVREEVSHMSDQLDHGPMTKWLIEQIRDSDISQAKLAEKVGISQAQLSRFLTKKPGSFQSIRLKTADKIVKALQADVRDMMKEKADLLAGLSATVGRMREEIEYWRGERDKLHEIRTKALTAKLEMDEAKKAMDVVVRFIETIESRIEIPRES